MVAHVDDGAVQNDPGPQHRPPSPGMTGPIFEGGRRIGVAYSTLKEAQLQAVSLERDGYSVIEILPTSLPKPNLI